MALCVATDLKFCIIIIIIIIIISLYVSQYSDWAAGWTIWSSHSGRGQEIFLSTKTLRPALWPLQLSFQLVREVHSSEIKRLGREAGHWILSSAAVKNEWNPTRLQGLNGENLYILNIIIIIII